MSWQPTLQDIQNDIDMACDPITFPTHDNAAENVKNPASPGSWEVLTPELLENLRSETKSLIQSLSQVSERVHWNMAPHEADQFGGRFDWYLKRYSAVEHALSRSCCDVIESLEGRRKRLDLNLLQSQKEVDSAIMGAEQYSKLTEACRNRLRDEHVVVDVARRDAAKPLGMRLSTTHMRDSPAFQPGVACNPLQRISDSIVGSPSPALARQLGQLVIRRQAALDEYREFSDRVQELIDSWGPRAALGERFYEIGASASPAGTGFGAIGDAFTSTTQHNQASTPRRLIPDPWWTELDAETRRKEDEEEEAKKNKKASKGSKR